MPKSSPRKLMKTKVKREHHKCESGIGAGAKFDAKETKPLKLKRLLKNADLKCESKLTKNVLKKTVAKEADERRNRLYIRLKKGFDGSSDVPIERQAMAVHPNILSVSFPRRGGKMRFFYGEFESEEMAMSAMKDLKQRGEIYVEPPTSLKVINKKITKIIKKKIPKSKKNNLRNVWN